MPGNSIDGRLRALNWSGARDDFLRAVLALGFEFDQKITGIGLDDVEAKGRAGAAG